MIKHIVFWRMTGETPVERHAQAVAIIYRHPEHRKAAPLVRAARCERRVVDYEA